MTNPLPTPQEVLDKFLLRDRTAVDEINDHGRINIEDKLAFTGARAQDTASMVVYILRYLAEQDTKNGIRQ